MTMSIKKAAALARYSRSLGWFRMDINRSSGFRRCPQCQHEIHAEVPAGRDVDVRVNDAIDDMMINHLVDDCPGERTDKRR